MQIKKYLMFLISFVFLISCGDESKSPAVQEKETIIMGVSADYPPFEFIKHKKIVGFDIDLANEIAKELGFKLYLKEMNFDSLIPALHSGRVDFVISGMTKTPLREKNVDFSLPYYAPSLAVLYKKDKPVKTVSSFNDKAIAVQLGSVMENFVRDEAKKYKIDIISLTRIPTMVQELKLGRVDAVLLEEAQAKEFVKKNAELDYSLVRDVDSEYSIAFPKNSNLKTKFNEVIIKIRDSGKLNELKAKWLS